MNATPIKHGRIAYLCSAKTATGYCKDAEVVLDDKNKTVVCNEHAK